MFDPVINEFIPNLVRINLYFYYRSIITLGNNRFLFGIVNTSRVDSLERFRKGVVEMFNNAVDNF